MAKVTNISDGPRGAYNKGVLVMANPRETIDADDYADEWFKGSRAKAESAGSEEPRPLAKMNKTELLETAKAEGVTVEDGASNKDIAAAIEAKRSGS